MPTRRRRTRSDAPVTRDEFDALMQRVRRVEQKAIMGLGVQSVLGGGGGGDDGYEWWFDGRSSSANDADTVGGYTPDEVPYLSDGSTPASSPTPTAQGGPRFFAVKWAAVANSDLVTYEVHVSATAGFTPGATTLAGETPGLLAFLRKLPDGSDFAYDTDYFFKIVAKDADGSAAPSTESAAEQLDANGTDDILAGSITADHFEAVMAMASAMLAGTWGGTNVQVGFGARDDGSGSPELDATFVGIRAYDGSGASDPVFRVDASDGTVQVKGRIYFGSNFGSKLTRNDMIQVAEQPGGSWADPVLEQSDSVADADVSSLDVVWPAAPTPGNELLMVITNWDSGGNGIASASGYTSIRNNVFGGVSNARQQIFRRSATGSDDVTVAFDKNVDVAVVEFYEWSGVSDTEDAPFATATAADGSSPADSGVSASSVTQRCLAFGAISLYGNFNVKTGIFPDFTLVTTPAGYTQIGDDSMKDNTDVGFYRFGNALATRVWSKVVDSGTVQLQNSVEDTDAWRSTVVTLKAKANAVESADADSARLYAADVAGRSYFHVIESDGRKSAVALGDDGQVWRMEIVAVNVNNPSTAAHTGGAGTISIPGLALNDYAFLMGKTDDATVERTFIVTVNPLCSVAGQVSYSYFNANAATVDPNVQTYYFLVIHRS